MTDDIERDGLKAGDAVLLTGAGGGFGRALALRFARLGARLVLWDRHEENLRETERLVKEAGGTCAAFINDLAESDKIPGELDAASGVYGDFYCLINNASIFPRFPILTMTTEVWKRTFDVNVTAPFLLSRGVAPAMIAARRGVIINLASGRALQGAVDGASYAASKAALVSLTKTLALDWAKHNIRVNSIVPGVSLTAQPLQGTTLEDLLERAPKRIPLGRIGMPDDVAGLAAYLVSPDAAFMTGQAVAINGGAIMTP